MWRVFRQVVVVGGVLISNGVWAAVVDKTFEPRVTIFKGTAGEAIEIVADKTDFLASYRPSLETFSSLHIPFRVRSVMGVGINYRMSLALSQHVCWVEGAAQPAPWDGVALSVDGESFTATLPVEVLESVVEKSHVLSVDYPKRPQMDELQSCYGTIGVVAEMVEL